ncbi:alkaline phosphatase family protein [Stenomitos frigidus ULC18]|uniref:Alkaline phosphatase family protein n=2 Tax=Stenomitos TaxID=1844270 RepID=A0A2T1E0V8_9CYAN|nr:alkaline phosphatase family protein [Stenomitos frigidus ULC18]
MSQGKRIFNFAITAILGGVAAILALPSVQTVSAAEKPTIKHVLLISVDGLHAVDLANYVKTHPDSTLAKLSDRGVTYTKAFASRPSDSFPGLLAIVTGGTPRSTGVYYDNSYDRKLSPPGSNCSTIGTEVVLDESIDINPDLLSGGGNPGFNASSIDPAKLPLDPSNGCQPVYPHSYLRVNTIFEVIKKAGGYTAWADKHPAYDLVNGPSGQGVDDLYTPEINNADSPTSKVAATEAYDDIKVTAILNQIDGKTATGAPATVPTIFGMNFQAVSVGEKLPTAGYTDAAATPSAELQDALEHTDASLGKMVAELKAQGLYKSTLIIISAKHGQSPIDPSKVNKPGSLLKLIPAIAPLVAKATEDDIALLWLTDQSKTSDVADALSANKAAGFIRKLYVGESLASLFDDPSTDSRTPDIIVQPIPGTIYTTSTKKIAEHGGFTLDDTNVALLVSNPRFEREKVRDVVTTTQIAPTILKALGLKPRALKAVRLEKTHVLPALELNDD